MKKTLILFLLLLDVETYDRSKDLVNRETYAVSQFNFRSFNHGKATRALQWHALTVKTIKLSNSTLRVHFIKLTKKNYNKFFS